MIKAAIFDMDGLLVDSEPLWERVNYDTFKELGIELTFKDRRKMMGRRTLENVRYLYEQHPWEGPSVEEVEDRMVRAVIRAVERDGVLKPGVHHVLSVCKEAGLKVAIASSARRDLIDAVVHKFEVEEHFDHIYSADFEPYGKPHPGVFLKVAKHLKAEPHDCVVFEDSPNGVLAAKAARMQCVAVPEPEHRDDKFIRTADAILDSLEEFDEELLGRLGK